MDRGTLGALSVVDASTLEATVTPESAQPTGRYTVELRMQDGRAYTRLPMVLDAVNDRWNQPELFLGYVNTPAWEDSPFSFVVPGPAGQETLYVGFVYIAVDSRCILDAAGPFTSNPYCTTVHGPVTAPERPSSTIGPFVDVNGVIDQSLPNLLPAGNPGIAKIGATMYLFKVGQDGYPGYLGTPLPDPQAIRYDGDDGLTAPTGLYFYPNGPGGYSMMYNVNPLMDNAMGCPGYPDVTSQDIFLLQDYDFNAPVVTLGQYVRVDPGGFFSNGTQNTSTSSCPEYVTQGHTPVTIPTAGAQDNPQPYGRGSALDAMLWEAEDGNLKISWLTAGSYPDGTWSAAYSGGPLAVAPGTFKAQPSLSDTELCYRVNHQMFCHTFAGPPYDDPGSYGPAVLQMQGTNWSYGIPGEVPVVGEQAMFTLRGQNCMSFGVTERGVVNADVNFGVAWVCE